MISAFNRVTNNSAAPLGRRVRRAMGLVAGLVVLVTLAGCASDAPLDTLRPETDAARLLYGLFRNVFFIATVVFFLVQGALLYMANRFRVKAPEDESQLYPDEEFPAQTHGHSQLEIAWTIGPALIMAVVAFMTWSALFELEEVTASENRQIQKVTVIGQQWWWEFQYHLDQDGVPDIVTAGDLVLPVGEEVELEITSRDVIHSFWVPSLNGKQDAVPGLVSDWTIEVEKPGRYPGECTEFCGLSHAYMEKWAVGLELEEWQRWRDAQISDAEIPASGTAAAGYDVFANQCASCHVINGVTSLVAADGETDGIGIYDGANRLIPKQTQMSGAAPNLTHFASRSSFAGGIFELYENVDEVHYLDLSSSGDLNRGQLEAWIKDAPSQKANYWNSSEGQRGMPPFPGLTDEDIDNLVEFLVTLD